MERLTEKCNDTENGIVYDLAPNNFSEDLSTHNVQCEVAINSIINKLGQLEDVEEELGIDLITLFKALKNGIWLKDKKDQYMPYHCLLRDDFILVLYEDIYKEEYLLNEYGKTWALTEEELL